MHSANNRFVEFQLSELSLCAYLSCCSSESVSQDELKDRAQVWTCHGDDAEGPPNSQTVCASSRVSTRAQSSTRPERCLSEILNASSSARVNRGLLSFEQFRIQRHALKRTRNISMYGTRRELLLLSPNFRIRISGRDIRIASPGIAWILQRR